MSKGNVKRHKMEVRESREADIPAVARRYYDTVHRVNARDYSAQQIEAWAPGVANESFWLERFKRYRVFVAEQAGVATGFAEFATTGHIDCFYMHHAWQRQGVGFRLMERREREARKRMLPGLFPDVSITARPFFEKMGFRVVREQTKRYRGVGFDQTSMAKRLASRAYRHVLVSENDWARAHLFA